MSTHADFAPRDRADPRSDASDRGRGRRPRGFRAHALSIATLCLAGACGDGTGGASADDPPGTDAAGGVDGTPGEAVEVASTSGLATEESSTRGRVEAAGTASSTGSYTIDELIPPDRVELEAPPSEPASDSEARSVEAEILELDLRDFQVRVEALRQRIALRPDRADLRLELGTLFHAESLARMAEVELLAAVRLDATLVKAHLLLADIYAFRGDLGRLYWHAREGLEHDPNVPGLYLLLATAHRSNGEAELAERVVDAGLARFPFDNDLRVLKANVLMDREAFAEARGLLEKAARDDPDNYRVHLLLANTLVELGEDEAAESEFELHARLMILKNTGLLDREEGLDEPLRAALLASHYQRLGQNDLARKELDRSLALEPNNPDARTVEAELLDALGDTTSALAILEELLVERPEHSRALRVLSRLLVDGRDATLRDPSRAVQLALQAAERSSFSNPRVLLDLARAQEAAEMYEEAKHTLRDVLRLDPTSEIARTRLESMLAATR